MLEFIKSTYFQDLLASFSVGVILFNTAGRIYAINAAAAGFFGVAPPEWVGRQWEQLFGSCRQLQVLEDRVNALLDQGIAAPPLSAQITPPGGRRVHCSISLTQLTYYEKVFGVFMEIVDVSHIVELHEREKEILQEKGRLEQDRFLSLQKMSMSVAHQIRNPAATIGGLARRLAGHRFDEERREAYLKTIIDCSSRLEQIVAAVSEYADMRLKRREKVAAAELIAAAREELVAAGGAGRALQAHLRWEIDLEPCRLSADRALLVTALREVLMNSLEAIGGCGGTITVRGRCRRTDGYLLEIIDNGCGISPGNRPFIFDPFFSTKPRGIGMGLNRAERIVQEHGGRLMVESVPGGGATVALLLPHPRPVAAG